MFSVSETTGVIIRRDITSEIVEVTRQLDKVQEEFGRDKIEIATKVIVADGNDNPDKSICEYDRINGIDMIIFGSRGLFAINIVHNATVPVLVTK